MKKSINILILFIITLVIGCTTKTENDFNGFVAGLTNGAYMKGFATFDPGTNSWTDKSILANTIDANNLANSSIGVKVRQWGLPVSKVNVYVVKNTDANQANWKFIKAYNVTDTNYFDIRVTAQEIATALGLQMNASAGNFAPGSIFTCYVETITSDGKKFTVNNSNFTASGANFFYPITSFRGSVVCPYNPATMAGNYRVVADGWQDWSIGDIIPSAVTATTATSLTLFKVYPNPGYPGAGDFSPIVVNINATSGVATVTNQTYGSYSGEMIAVSTQGSANFVYSCTGTITLLLRHHVPNAPNLSYGNYQLTLVKVP